MSADDSLVNQRRILFRRQSYVLVSWLVINVMCLLFAICVESPRFVQGPLLLFGLQWSLGALYLVFGNRPIFVRMMVAAVFGCLPYIGRELFLRREKWSEEIDLLLGGMSSISLIATILYVISWTGIRASHPLLDTSNIALRGQFGIRSLLILTTFTGLLLAQFRLVAEDSLETVLLSSIATVLLLISTLILWHRIHWILIGLWLGILCVGLTYAQIELHFGSTAFGEMIFLTIASVALSKLLIDATAMVVLRWLGYRLEWGRASKNA